MPSIIEQVKKGRGGGALVSVIVSPCPAVILHKTTTRTMSTLETAPSAAEKGTCPTRLQPWRGNETPCFAEPRSASSAQNCSVATTQATEPGGLWGPYVDVVVEAEPDRPRPLIPSRKERDLGNLGGREGGFDVSAAHAIAGTQDGTSSCDANARNEGRGGGGAHVLPLSGGTVYHHPCPSARRRRRSSGYTGP